MFMPSQYDQWCKLTRRIATPRLNIAGLGSPRGLYESYRGRKEDKGRMKVNCSGKRSDDTYDRDNERDPHEEVEPTKHIVENLLPIYCLRRRNDILSKSLGEPFDSGRFKP